MWQQYRKTFLRMQVAIALVTVGMYRFLAHDIAPTLTFFLVLQVAAVAGAHWGAHLRKRFNPNG